MTELLKWKYYSRKYGRILEYYSQQVYKEDTEATCTEVELYIFLEKLFEQQCVILHALLNQGKLSDNCSFIGLNDEDFISQCLFNANCLSSEMLSPKKYGQVIFDKKGYQDAILVSFTATTPTITTDTYTVEQISYPP